jgi:hypothetical protein
MKTVGQCPPAAEYIKKGGSKVTKRKDLHPAQPVLRKREGTSKEKTTDNITGARQRREGATKQQSSTTWKVTEH